MAALEVLSSKFINFHNHDEELYQFVNVKQIKLLDLSDKEFIDRIATSLFYVDDIIWSGDKAPYDLEPAHGPYSLKYIRSESFHLADIFSSQDEIEAWATKYQTLPDALRAEIDQIKNLIFRDGLACYKLADLPRPECEHWYGAALATDGFYEYVIINRGVGEAWLVNCSDD